jgi:hypothetical protein
MIGLQSLHIRPHELLTHQLRISCADTSFDRPIPINRIKQVSSEKQMRRSLAIFFIYVAVFLLLFAAAARGEEPKQKTTAAATKTDAALSQEPVRWSRSSLWQARFDIKNHRLPEDYLPMQLLCNQECDGFSDRLWNRDKSYQGMSTSIRDRKIKRDAIFVRTLQLSHLRYALRGSGHASREVCGGKS